MLSFRNRILILLIGLVVGAQTVTLFTALARTSSTERARADAQLTAGAQIAHQLMMYRERQLANAVAVLASDYGLREAVASADKPTVASALGNHASRIGADLTVVIDLAGNMIARGEGTATLSPALVNALHQAAERGVRGAQFIESDQVVYQVFIAPVRAPDEIARVALGFLVDTELAQQFRNLVGVDIAFIAGNGTGNHMVAATVPSMYGTAKSLSANLHDMPERVDVSGTEYLVTGTHISNGNLPLDIALFKPMREVMAPFRQLAWNLGLIIGATLAAAIIAGLYLGRTAARPVLRLAAGAARIAAGDYSTRVEASGGRELANLADAFNSMQVGIADRESQLLHMARYDVQTGLPNRIQAEEWLAQHLRQVGRDQRVLILLLAVVNLKEISASLGFGIAEQLVRHLASQLGQWQKDGLVARLDAASFVVLMPVRDAVDIETMARRVRDQAQQPLHTAGISLQANVVMGVAEAPQHSANAAEALRCAEAAVEAALQSQESIALFERSSDDIRRRHLRLGAELPQALKSGQLFLHYQPKARASDAVVQGVEALVRWRHPEIGMVSPGEFVPIAERTGASGELTRWVLRSALQQLGRWHAAGMQVDMAVNLSGADLLDTSLLHFVLDLLREAQVPAGALTLEITESVFIRDAEAAQRNVELLRVAGVRFSVDDFGTGYSSLSQLRQLAVDELKIDQSFVRAMTSTTEGGAIIRAIIELAHGLGLRVVAEGVETDAQWKMLSAMHCDYGQGFLISAPVAAAEVEPMLRKSVTPSVCVVPEHTSSVRVLELRRRE